MFWPNVGRQYLKLFTQVARESEGRQGVRSRMVSALAENDNVAAREAGHFMTADVGSFEPGDALPHLTVSQFVSEAAQQSHGPQTKAENAKTFQAQVAHVGR
jgi:hypothetical protein